MKRTVKIGLVGTGEIGQVHAQAHAADGRDGVVHRRPDSAGGRDSVCPHNSRRRLYPSFEALLDDPTVDARGHLPAQRPASGVRRPSLAGRQARALREADRADAGGCRRHARCRAAGGPVPDDRPRAAILARVSRSQGGRRRRRGRPTAGHFRPADGVAAGRHAGRSGWRHDPRRSGGAVLDMQIHDLDVFCWFFDARPLGVLARAAFARRRAEPRLHALGVSRRTAGLCRGQLHDARQSARHLLSCAGHRAVDRVHVQSGGVSRCTTSRRSSRPRPGRRWCSTKWKEPPQSLYVPATDSFPLAFRDEVGYFAECIRTGQPPQIGTGEQARQALEIALASAISCETGQPVTLDAV